jgi:hypothetical protein
MAIRKKTEETFVVQGDRGPWLEKARKALEDGGFSDIKELTDLWQFQARYKKPTVWGLIDVTLTPADQGSTQLTVVATSNVDNIYALFRSPGRRIMDAFKGALPVS